MKQTLFIVFFLMGLFNSTGALAENEGCAERVVAEDASNRARYFGELLDLELIKKDLRRLTGKENFIDGKPLKDRYTISNRNRVRRFLLKRLAKLQIPSLVEGPFEDKDHPGPINIIGEIQGTKHPEKIIEFNAHYDTTHKGAPGADDNGSGLALVLELARLFSKNPPACTVRFIFADLEERGFLGTSLHVNNLKARKEKIEGAIVIDMIGYSPKKKDGTFVVEVGGRWSFLKEDTLKLNRQLANNFLYQFKRFTDREIVVRPDLSEAKPGTADHGPYWHSGYPALLVSAPYEGECVNPNYHCSSDDMDGINWEYYENVSRATAESAAYLTGASIQEPADFSETLTLIASYADAKVAHGTELLPEEQEKPRRDSYLDIDEEDEEAPFLSTSDLTYTMREQVLPFIYKGRGQYAVLRFPYKTTVVLPAGQFTTYHTRLGDFIERMAKTNDVVIVKLRENISDQEKLARICTRARELYLGISPMVIHQSGETPTTKPPEEWPGIAPVVKAEEKPEERRGFLDRMSRWFMEAD